MLADLLPVWTITFQDASGSSSLTRGTFKAGYDTGSYLAALLDLAGKAEALSGCVAVRFAVTYRVKDSSPFGPRRTEHIQTLAQWAFNTPSIPAFMSFETPITIEQTVTDGCFAGIDIDTSRSEVADFIAAVEGGLFCDPFGADIGPICSVHLAIGA